MGGLRRHVARRISRLEQNREREQAPELRDKVARRLRSLFDQFDPDELGAIIASEADRSDGQTPTISDVYLKWESLDGPPAWDALQYLVKLCETQGTLGDWNILDELGITATRGRAHTSMGYLERRAERLRD